MGGGGAGGCKFALAGGAEQARLALSYSPEDLKYQSKSPGGGEVSPEFSVSPSSFPCECLFPTVPFYSSQGGDRLRASILQSGRSHDLGGK